MAGSTKANRVNEKLHGLMVDTGNMDPSRQSPTMGREEILQQLRRHAGEIDSSGIASLKAACAEVLEVALANKMTDEKKTRDAIAAEETAETGMRNANFTALPRRLRLPRAHSHPAHGKRRSPASGRRLRQASFGSSASPKQPGAKRTSIQSRAALVAAEWVTTGRVAKAHALAPSFVAKKTSVEVISIPSEDEEEDEAAVGWDTTSSTSQRKTAHSALPTTTTPTPPGETTPTVLSKGTASEDKILRAITSQNSLRSTNDPSQPEFWVLPKTTSNKNGYNRGLWEGLATTEIRLPY